MPHQPLLTRRQMLACSGLSLSCAVAGAATPAPSAAPRAPRTEFGYCLNFGTISGQKLTLAERVQIAAEAGYQAIEPWIREIEDYRQRGGVLADLKQRIADLGLRVANTIGFPDWLNDDEAKRTAGLERFQRDMELSVQIGAEHIAAPPIGATQAPMELAKVVERYRTVLDLGRQQGIVAALELWGGSKTICRLGEAAYVLAEAGRPDARAILDVFHIYRGGSDFSGLRFFHGPALPVFHVNDYPADPPREKINDSARVYPGDGVAPLGNVFRALQHIGFRGLLSLEVFNRDYWKQDALAVARTGLEKTRAAVAKALAE